MELLQSIFFAILIFCQVTVISTTLIFCNKFLKPKKEKEVAPTMASRSSVGPDGKVQSTTQQIPGAATTIGAGAASTTPSDGGNKKIDDGTKKSDEKKPDPVTNGDKKCDATKEKKDEGAAAAKKNDLDQSKGKHNSKEDDGGGEGYENCNEMTPSQLQKIANEVK